MIRALRRNFGLTLEDIEKLTGVPRTNVSAIENGRMETGVKRATLIAAVFGLHPSVILFPQGYERKESKAVERIRKAAFKTYLLTD